MNFFYFEQKITKFPGSEFSKTENTEVSKLNREISRLLKNESKLKNEVRALGAQLEGHSNQTSTNDKLMQLRGKFLMTIEDHNKADNTRLILQVRDMQKMNDDGKREEEEDTLEF